MKSRTPVLLVLLIAATFFAGCGAKPAATTSPPAMTAAVDMQSFLFKPDSVTVAKGGTVTWTNKDGTGHDVHANDATFASGDPGGILKDQKFTYTFTTAGTFGYYCKLHGTATSGMHGTVIVK